MKENYKEILVDDEISEIIIRHLDIDRNGDIDKHEFKTGVSKLLALRNSQKQSQESNQVRNIMIKKCWLHVLYLTVQTGKTDKYI